MLLRLDTRCERHQAHDAQAPIQRCIHDGCAIDNRTHGRVFGLDHGCAAGYGDTLRLRPNLHLDVDLGNLSNDQYYAGLLIRLEALFVDREVVFSRCQLG